MFGFLTNLYLNRIYMIIILYYIVYSYSSINNCNKLNFKLRHFDKKIYSLTNKSMKNKCLSCVIYNLQRLPYLLRNIDIDHVIHSYDLCILQEYFNDLFLKKNRYLINTNKFFNCGGKKMLSSKLIDSGLVTTSSNCLEYIDFIQFKKYKSVDKFANKGFLISRLNLSNNDILYVINTHLQNFYTVDDYNCEVITEQLNTIDKYITSNILNLNNKYISLIVAGDFNRNLKDISWTIKPDHIVHSDTPTVWDNRDGLIPISTPVQTHSTQHPYWTDGAFLWSTKLKIHNISSIITDKYTDHCGIKFDIYTNDLVT